MRIITTRAMHICCLAGAATALLHVTTGFAQASGAAQPAADATPVLDEVLVTAQKRSENIRDVPISITALTGDQVEQAGVTDTFQLAKVVPGLNIQEIGGSLIPSIRGVSSFLTNPGTDANVATYIDNVYIPSMQASILDLPDVSRVDVLKGPQGTLFGRNATGGAIQIFTRDPNLDTLGGDVSLGAGNYKAQTFKGFVSGPLIPGKLAASLSGFEETHDNYSENQVPGVPLNHTFNYLLRAKVLAQPTDDTRILLTAYNGKHSDPSAIMYNALDGNSSANGVPGAIVASKPWTVSLNTAPYNNTRSSGIDLQINQKTPIGEFTGIGAWTYTKSAGPVPTDVGGYPPPYTGEESSVNEQNKSWSGEIDFASRQWGGFSFVAGTNYYRNNSEWNPLTVVSNFPNNVYSLSIFSGQSSRAAAVFGEATYQLTDQLIVVAGVRESDEKRGVTGSAAFAILPPGGPFYDWGSRTYKSTTERGSLRYKFTPDTTAYFTYSTGFKSGNFVATSVPFYSTPAQCAAAAAANPGSCAFPPSLLPEKVTAFEVGIKSQPMSWLSTSAALFHYKLSDIQIQSYTQVCAQAPCPPNPEVELSTYSNAAAGKMYGGEADLDAQLTSELRATAGISYVHATFSNYENASWDVPRGDGLGLRPTPVQSADGKTLPRAPKVTANLSLNYSKHLPAGTASFVATGYYADRVFFDVGNVISQPGYATLGLRTSFSPATIPNLTLTLWGNNVTDAHVINSSIIELTAAEVSYAAPRTYGGTVNYAF